MPRGRGQAELRAFLRSAEEAAPGAPPRAQDRGRFPGRAPLQWGLSTGLGAARAGNPWRGSEGPDGLEQNSFAPRFPGAGRHGCALPRSWALCSPGG